MPVSTEVRDTILQRQRDGATITQIAQELGLSRPTVYKSLATVDNWDVWIKDKSSNIRRLAYNAVERGLSKGDARLGMEWLRLTDLSPNTGESIHVAGDATFQTLVQAVPVERAASSTPSLPPGASTTESTSTTSSPVSMGTEAAAKGDTGSICLASRTNFLQVSDSELLAEIQRRGLSLPAQPTEATDAEVLTSNE